MIDRYTKAVLTFIAAALVALVVQQPVQNARAQSGFECGSARNPCYVRVDSPVEVTNTILSRLHVTIE